MEIKNAVLGDKEEFINLETNFSQTSACSSPISKEMASSNFSAAMDGTYARLLMMKEGKTTIGYAYLSLCHSTEKGGLCLWLEELYVKPQYRGGMGISFLNWLCDEYKGKAKSLRLEVSINNNRAKNLYLNNGFKDVTYGQMYKDIE